MPDNWTPVFDLTNAEEVAGINAKADEEIDKMIVKLASGVTGDYVNDKLGKMMEFVYPSFYKALSKTSHLHVEDSCIVVQSLPFSMMIRQKIMDSMCIQRIRNKT